MRRFLVLAVTVALVAAVNPTATSAHHPHRDERVLEQYAADT